MPADCSNASDCHGGDCDGYKVDRFGMVIRPAFWLNPES